MATNISNNHLIFNKDLIQDFKEYDMPYNLNTYEKLQNKNTKLTKNNSYIFINKKRVKFNRPLTSGIDKNTLKSDSIRLYNSKSSSNYRSYIKSKANSHYYNINQTEEYNNSPLYYYPRTALDINVDAFIYNNKIKNKKEGLNEMQSLITNNKYKDNTNNSKLDYSYSIQNTSGIIHINSIENLHNIKCKNKDNDNNLISKQEQKDSKNNKNAALSMAKVMEIIGSKNNRIKRESISNAINIFKLNNSVRMSVQEFIENKNKNLINTNLYISKDFIENNKIHISNYKGIKKENKSKINKHKNEKPNFKAITNKISIKNNNLLINKSDSFTSNNTKDANDKEKDLMLKSMKIKIKNNPFIDYHLNEINKANVLASYTIGNNSLKQSNTNNLISKKAKERNFKTINNHSVTRVYSKKKSTIINVNKIRSSLEVLFSKNINPEFNSFKKEISNFNNANNLNLYYNSNKLVLKDINSSLKNSKSKFSNINTNENDLKTNNNKDNNKNNFNKCTNNIFNNVIKARNLNTETYKISVLSNKIELDNNINYNVIDNKYKKDISNNNNNNNINNDDLYFKTCTNYILNPGEFKVNHLPISIQNIVKHQNRLLSKEYKNKNDFYKSINYINNELKTNNINTNFDCNSSSLHLKTNCNLNEDKLKKSNYKNTNTKEKINYIYRNGVNNINNKNKLNFNYNFKNNTYLKNNKSNVIKNDNNVNNNKYNKKKLVSNNDKLEDIYTKTNNWIDYNYKSTKEQSNNINNNNKIAVLNENKIVFKEDFDLANKDTQFSKEFRVCDNYIIPVNNIDIIKKQEANKKRLLKKITKSNKSLKQDLNKQISKENIFLIKNNKNFNILKEKIIKWKRCIITAAIHFKRLNCSIYEFYNNKILLNDIKDKNNQVYNDSNINSSTNLNTNEVNTLCDIISDKTSSWQFFQAIKSNDVSECTRLLQNNKFLVHDKDYRNQSPLHWASKRNFIDIVYMLIKYGSGIDSVDSSGRTPLHTAAYFNKIEVVIILLKELANPLLTDKLGFTASQLTSDNKIKYYLKRVKALYIIYSSLKRKEALTTIKNGIDYIFKHEEYRFQKKEEK